VVLLLAMTARAEVVVFNEATSSQDITSRASYWVDEGGMADHQSVLALPASAFTPIQEDVFNLGITVRPVWVRFTILNMRASGRLILEYTNPRTTGVDLFVPVSGGGHVRKQAGAGFPFYARELYHASPAFLAGVPAGEPWTYYLRLTNTGNMRFSLMLWEEAAFHRHAATSNIAGIALFGMITAIALFNFFVFFSLRERAYLYLGCLVVCFLFTHLSFTGIGAMLFGPDAPWVGERGPTVFILLTLGVGALFATSLAAPGDPGRGWARAGLVIGGLTSGCAAVAAVAPGSVRSYLLMILALVVPAYILLLGAATWRRNLPYARLFLVAWGTLGVVTIFVTFVSLRLFNVAIRGELVFSITFVASSLLWSFALTDRLKRRDDEVRELLEARVRERTQKLESALTEVKALSGLLPICAGCKKVRDDTGYWRNVEAYLQDHTEVNLSHGICPECTEKFYPEFVQRQRQHRMDDDASTPPGSP
jgi:hypothetical protein